MCALTSPFADGGRVPAVSLRAGADGPVSDHLTVGAHTAGSLARVPTVTVQAGLVWWTGRVAGAAHCVARGQWRTALEALAAGADGADVVAAALGVRTARRRYARLYLLVRDHCRTIGSSIRGEKS